MLDNALPHETFEVGLVKGGGSGGGSGDVGVFGVSRGIESGGVSSSMSVSERARVTDRHGCHGRGRGGRGGYVGVCGRGSPRKRITVGEGYQPTSIFSRGQSYDLLTLDQTSDAVCPVVSDARGDTLPANAKPDAYDDGELQGIIKLPPPQNDDDHGAIREELDLLVASATSDEFNVEKVLRSVVVDASRTSHNNGNIIFLKYLCDGRSGLFLFDTMEVFEAYHANTLDLMDRKNSTNLWKAMQIYFEE